jgi:hypothetical protein
MSGEAVRSLRRNGAEPPNVGGTCYYYLTTNPYSTAASYYWSCNSDMSGPEITSTNSTQNVGVDCPDLLQNTTVPIYIETNNACGHSSPLFYRDIAFPKIQNCMLKPIFDSNNQIQSEKNINFNTDSLYLNSIGNGLFFLTINESIDNLQISIYSSFGVEIIC